MRAYIQFLKSYFEPVFFGFLLTLFSSFGQTFLISLFVPFILAEFAFSNSAFGAYYAIATIASSIMLLRFGHIIDERPIRPFTTKTILLLTVACLLLAIAVHPLMVVLALFGLRLGGQGLMGHICFSVMSRYFNKNRGKAISISSLGYAVGEMILPILITGLIFWLDWRLALVVSACMIPLFLFPLLRKLDLERMDVREIIPVETISKRKFFLEMMKGRKFWLIAFPTLAQSSLVTAFFFYQYIMAEERGWPMEVYSLFFAGYAIVGLLFSLYGGMLTDKFSAKKVFPFYLLPLILALLSIAVVPGIAAAIGFLFFTGICIGAGGVIRSAAIAELYGTEKIGKVRSLFTVVMVVSTAIGPVIFGLFLDQGFTFSQLGVGAAIFTGIIMINSFRIWRE